MQRFFNTTGPCDPSRHFMIPPERRLKDLSLLVEREQYFVLHAPRQTGKTTAMQRFAHEQRASGRVVLLTSLEESRGVMEVGHAEDLWMAAIASDAEWDLPPPQRPPAPGVMPAGTAGSRFGAFLRAWCARAELPVVLLLDEVDVVRGEPMVSLLSQLRRGFAQRGVGRFPVSVALIGMRDLRDYIVEAKSGEPVHPGSPFNVKSQSLTMQDFTPDEVRELLRQHTEETGQRWSEEALERVFERTQGQPYLVNAVANHATTWGVTDRAVEIGVSDVDAAIQALILARVTHLDNLAERLKEPRVARIVEAVLLGDEGQEIDKSSDDFSYVRDLGLVREGPSGIEAANPIYREVLVRQLIVKGEAALPAPWWRWRLPDGRLDAPALVDAFLQWWRENGDILRESDQSLYREAAAHLAFMGFLQRVVNGGGTVEREYAAARDRVDLVVSYAGERHVFELKRVSPRRGLERTVSNGTAQLAGYLETLNVAEGWLLVFDPRPGRTWEERLWRQDLVEHGRALHLRGA